jgi:hypothetical protein
LLFAPWLSRRLSAGVVQFVSGFDCVFVAEHITLAELVSKHYDVLEAQPHGVVHATVPVQKYTTVGGARLFMAIGESEGI